MEMLKRFATLIVFSLLVAAGAQAASAETFPSRTVKIIVPTAPGGAIDTTARVVAEKLQAKWGKPVVIENKPGAAMRIGAELAAKSPADGYTLLVAHDGTMAMNPVVYPDLPYDPVKDFAPVALISSIPEVIMVNKSVPAHSLQELIALAKREPGKLNHATGGTATLLSLELLKAMAGIDITSVKYNGGAPAVRAVIGGEVQVIIADISTGGPGLQSNNVRPLAVTTLQRVKQYPNLPTFDQSGVKGYDVQTWMGMFAPAKTPKDVLAKIEADVKEAVGSADVRDRLEKIGMTVRSGTAAEMKQVLATDIAKWGKLVRERNIKIGP
jgi:tripartite-type tricarboxylate transporter receptor subunit TctC